MAGIFGSLFAPTADPATDPYGLLSGSYSNWNALRDLGFGLLANSGPSFQPQSLGSMIGKAGQYQRERQDQSVINDLRRASVLQTKQEMEGVKNIQAFMKDNPDLATSNPVLAAILASGSPDAVKAVAGAFADPTLPFRMTSAQADAGLKTAALGTAQADNNIAWESARAAEDAVKYLANKPGGSTLLNNETFLSAVSKGQTFIPDAVLTALLPKGVDPKDVPQMVAAAQTVLKSRATLAAQLASGNQSVLGLENFLTAQGAGASPDVQAEKFRQARVRAEQIAKAGGKGWELPEPQQYVWRGGESVAQGGANTGIGTAITDALSGGPAASPPPLPPGQGIGTINGQPAPLLSPPSVAPAQAAPGAPKRVPSLSYAPDGDAQFRSFDEVKRAESNGWLKGSTGIWVNGQHYNWVPDQ